MIVKKSRPLSRSGAVWRQNVRVDANFSRSYAFSYSKQPFWHQNVPGSTPALPRLCLGCEYPFFIDFRRFCVWKRIWSWKSRVHSRVLAPFGARTREWTRLFPNNDDVHSPNSTRILKRGSFAGGIPIQKPGFCPRRVLADFGDFIWCRELPLRPHLPAHIPRMTLVASNSLKLIY